MELKIDLKRTGYLLISAVLILIVLHFFPANLSTRIKGLFNLESSASIPLRYTAIAFIATSVLLFILGFWGYGKIRNTRFWLFFIIPLTILYLVVSFIILIISSPSELSSNISDLFNLNLEKNIPTWFSTILLFSISGLSYILFRIKSNQLSERRFWIVFSLVIGFLSLDEAASLHEKLDFFLAKWIYVYAPIAGVFFIFCIYYLIKIGNRNLTIKLISGLIIYASGGLACEMFSYIFEPLPPVIQEIEFVAEEGFEMIGAVLILLGCLEEISKSFGMNKTIDVSDL